MGLKVVVTGGSGGIGRATALRFANDGHEVFITGRSDAKLEETVNLATGGDRSVSFGEKRLKLDTLMHAGAKGGAIHKAVGDVGVEADVLKNYEEATKALGHVDVLVLNAGSSWTGPLEDHSAAQFDSIFNANVKGVFLWLKAALPAFKKQGFGQIVIVNSVFGTGVVLPNFSVYAASKFALTGLAEGLRLEVKGTGIKVGSVLPGAVDTNIWTGGSFDQNSKADTRETYGLDMALAPQDVASAIATIVYQDPRSDIDLLRVWPNYGPRKALG